MIPFSTAALLFHSLLCMCATSSPAASRCAPGFWRGSVAPGRDMRSGRPGAKEEEGKAALGMNGTTVTSTTQTAAPACSPCPQGMDCSTQTPCAEGKLALKGSGRCCPRQIQCPHGRVVDSTQCLCATLGCANASDILLYMRNRSRALVCLSPSDYPIAAQCLAQPRCAPGQALDTESCACLSVDRCTAATDARASLFGSGGGGGGLDSGGTTSGVRYGQRWRSGEGLFVCVFGPAAPASVPSEL
jgi:hypothetical protein